MFKYFAATLLQRQSDGRFNFRTKGQRYASARYAEINETTIKEAIQSLSKIKKVVRIPFVILIKKLYNK